MMRNTYQTMPFGRRTEVFGIVRRIVLILSLMLLQARTAEPEICGAHGPPQITGYWDRAISTYDPIGRIMYLEFDVQYPAEEAEACLANEALVEMDGIIMARSQELEAGVLLENVLLGRHWLFVRVVAADGQQLSQQMVEFVLPFHFQLLITDPPNRHIISRDARSETLRVCFSMSPPANCADNGCVLPIPTPSLRLTVDGVKAGDLFRIDDPDAWSTGAGKGCGVVSGFGELREGRHSLAVELVDLDEVPLGPISYLHHVILSHGPEPLRGYTWLQDLGEEQSLIESMWDVQIETDGLFEASDGAGHGVFINPCLYRIPGADHSAWGVLFREHQLKGDGYQGYRMRLDPSRQWDGVLTWEGKGDGESLRAGVTGLRISVGESQKLDIAMEGPPSLEGGVGPQDARFVSVGGRSLLWFNGNSRRLPSRVTQHFAELPAEWWVPGRRAALPSPLEVRESRAVFEKNFVAFDYRGSLLFAYSVEPHTVFHLDVGSGEAEAGFSSTNALLREAIAGGDVWLHGGAVAVKVVRGGRVEYLSVCHSKEPDRERYRSFAYTFEAAPPFRIAAWSPALALQGRIQMAMSLEVVGGRVEDGVCGGGEGAEMVVGYGSEDKTMRVAFFALDAVLGSLVDIASDSDAHP